MKTSTIICLAVVLSLSAAPAMADFYTVDLGGTNVLSDPGITLADWGQAEVTGSGFYGGIGPAGPGGVGCRMVLGDTASGDTSIYATITFPKPIDWASITHLDGCRDDSFSVTVDGADWGGYTYSGNTSEYWLTTSYSGTPGSTLMITITNPDTTWAATWGQLAIDKVEAVPVPGALLLGILGLGAVGVKLRTFR